MIAFSVLLDEFFGFNAGFGLNQKNNFSTRKLQKQIKPENRVSILKNRKKNSGSNIVAGIFKVVCQIYNAAFPRMF